MIIDPNLCIPVAKRIRPKYTDRESTQTLRQGLEEYYAVNPNVTDPRELPPAFAKILLAHDVTHIILGLATDMYDELKLLPLCFWTSNYKFRDYLRTVQDPTIRPAIGIMFDDMVKQHGLLWLFGPSSPYYRFYCQKQFPCGLRPVDPENTIPFLTMSRFSIVRS